MASPEDHMVPAYGSYLQLNRLLASQRPPDFARLRPDDDPTSITRDAKSRHELLFIVVHQTFELWFKVILNELGRARDLLGRIGTEPSPERVSESDIPRVTACIRRVNTIIPLAMGQFGIMETMSPLEFLEFRDLITPASGFQSVQFRELELLAGLPDDVRLDFEGVAYEIKLADQDRERLERRRGELTLRAALYDWLARTPVDDAFPGFTEAFLEAYFRYLDDEADSQDRNPNLAPSQRLAARQRITRQKDEARAYLLESDEETRRAHRAFLFIASYRHEPLLVSPDALVEALVEFEQGFRMFRFRHARMVERMIGQRTGTGGSPGVAYLDRTSDRYRIFGSLLEARSLLLAPQRVPPLPARGLLGFRYESGS
jgi:tryptophan 2,3-dioxygenase